jgi:hypothetical protein
MAYLMMTSKAKNHHEANRLINRGRIITPCVLLDHEPIMLPSQPVAHVYEIGLLLPLTIH